jgi:hypothetical protein
LKLQVINNDLKNQYTHHIKNKYMQIKTKSFIQAVSLLILCFVFCPAAFSQSNNTPLSKIYFQAGAGATSKKGIFSDLGVQAVLKNNWITTVSYQSVDMEPKNIPADYDPGTTIILFIPIEQETPSANMKILSFTLGKYIKGGKNTWFTTEAGLSVVSAKKTTFSKNTGDMSSWYILFAGETPSNYTYTQEKKSTMGAILKADFNWPFSSFAGVGAGVFANFNSMQSPVGFEIKLILGKMNRDKKS